MFYCLNCGAKNENQATTCKKCNIKLKEATVSKSSNQIQGRGVVHPDYFVRGVSTPNDEDTIPLYNEDIMPEPFTPEEIDSIRVAGASTSVKIKDIVKNKKSEKKASRKRKKNS